MCWTYSRPSIPIIMGDISYGMDFDIYTSRISKPRGVGSSRVVPLNSSTPITYVFNLLPTIHSHYYGRYLIWNGFRYIYISYLQTQRGRVIGNSTIEFADPENLCVGPIPDHPFPLLWDISHMEWISIYTSRISKPRGVGSSRVAPLNSSTPITYVLDLLPTIHSQYHVRYLIWNGFRYIYIPYLKT